MATGEEAVKQRDWAVAWEAGVRELGPYKGQGGKARQVWPKGVLWYTWSWVCDEYAMLRGQWKVLRWSKTDGLWLGVGLKSGCSLCSCYCCSLKEMGHYLEPVLPGSDQSAKSCLRECVSCCGVLCERLAMSLFFEVFKLWEKCVYT